MSNQKPATYLGIPLHDDQDPGYEYKPKLNHDMYFRVQYVMGMLPKPRYLAIYVWDILFESGHFIPELHSKITALNADKKIPTEKKQEIALNLLDLTAVQIVKAILQHHQKYPHLLSTLEDKLKEPLARLLRPTNEVSRSKYFSIVKTELDAIEKGAIEYLKPPYNQSQPSILDKKEWENSSDYRNEAKRFIFNTIKGFTQKITPLTPEEHIEELKTEALSRTEQKLGHLVSHCKELMRHPKAYQDLFVLKSLFSRDIINANIEILEKCRKNAAELKLDANAPAVVKRAIHALQMTDDAKKLARGSYTIQEDLTFLVAYQRMKAQEQEKKRDSRPPSWSCSSNRNSGIRPPSGSYRNSSSERKTSVESLVL